MKTNKLIKFKNPDNIKKENFKKELVTAVENKFMEKGISKKGNFNLYSKVLIIAAWFLVSYYCVMITSLPDWLVPVGVISFALATAAIGFNIMHDGAHGSFSRKKAINKIAAFSIEFVGASYYLWRVKHNVLHHTYTNIKDADDDIAIFGMRVSPEQKWHGIYRWQHIYGFALYCLVSLLWVSYSDFTRFFSRRMGSQKIPKPSVPDIITFLGMKLFYVAYMLAIPLLFHSISYVILVFLTFHAILGFTLAIVFQLAHITEDNKFPKPKELKDWNLIENEWMIHQVETTADFAPRNKLLGWYIGGLNYQIEHHTFREICHVHYSKISQTVKEICEKFGIKYVSYKSFWQALREHYKFLKVLGQKPQTNSF